MRKISIVGVGRLGGALALALSKNGYEIENLIGRNPSSLEKIAAAIDPQPNISNLESFSPASREIIFITTQDAEIEFVAKILSRKITGEPLVFHTSGSLSSEILSELKKFGASVGSLHPLVSVSDAFAGAENFTDAFFCIEGDEKASVEAEKIVSDLGGKSFGVETARKALYHAAAVTASGHFVALIDAALEMLSKCGLNKPEAQKVLLPLIKSTVGNLENQTPEKALTGTFARADVETFERHLKILFEVETAQTVELYLQLAERSLHLAERQGANAERLEKMRSQILLAKKNIKC